MRTYSGEEPILYELLYGNQIECWYLGVSLTLDSLLTAICRRKRKLVAKRIIQLYFPELTFCFRFPLSLPSHMPDANGFLEALSKAFLAP